MKSHDGASRQQTGGERGEMEKGTKGEDEKAVEKIWMKALAHAVEHDYEPEGDPVAEEMCNRIFRDPRSEKARERFRRGAYCGTGIETDKF